MFKKAGLLLLVVCLGCASAAFAAKQGAIEPKCAEILKAMSDNLQAMPEFGFKAEILHEEVYQSGQKVQQGREAAIWLKRPDRFKAEVADADGSKIFFYESGRFALLEKELNLYSVADAAPTVDLAIEMLRNVYGIAAPLGDFLYSDVYAALTDEVTHGAYLGQDMVRGQVCEHLFFEQKDIDWQIWVSKGEKPLPCKLVITEKKMKNSPQYMAVFYDFKAGAQSADFFSFKAPQGSQQIELVPKSKTAR